MADRQNNSNRKRRRGYRSFFTILILLITGGVIFYFGWVQFKLDAGEYGVIYTKTHGWEEKPIVNGEFAWRWQGLIPTNLKVQVFKPELRSVSLKKTGILPSGKMYASILGGDEDFEWALDTKINYLLIPDTLPALLANDMFNSNLDALYTDYESKLEGIVSDFMGKMDTFSSLSQLEENLMNDLSSQSDSFTVKSVVVTDVKYPDMELYTSAKQMAETYIRNREKILVEIEEIRMRKTDDEEARINLLARIGKVLTENPILLELFNLEGQPGTSLLPSMAE